MYKYKCMKDWKFWQDPDTELTLVLFKIPSAFLNNAILLAETVYLSKLYLVPDKFYSF